MTVDLLTLKNRYIQLDFNKGDILTLRTKSNKSIDVVIGDLPELIPRESIWTVDIQSHAVEHQKDIMIYIQIERIEPKKYNYTLHANCFSDKTKEMGSVSVTNISET